MARSEADIRVQADRNARAYLDTHQKQLWLDSVTYFAEESLRRHLLLQEIYTALVCRALPSEMLPIIRKIEKEING